jgi:hypothetical protein
MFFKSGLTYSIAVLGHHGESRNVTLSTSIRKWMTVRAVHDALIRYHQRFAE